MAAYRQVYDSRHLQADWDQLRNPTLLRSVIEYGLPLPIFYLGYCKHITEASMGCSKLTEFMLASSASCFRRGHFGVWLTGICSLACSKLYQQNEVSKLHFVDKV